MQILSLGAALILLFGLMGIGLAGCQPGPAPQANQVLAVETFLADITQNIARDRLSVESLIPAGLDPHAFEPTPQDVVKIAKSRAIIANGAGIEAWLDKVLANAGSEAHIIQASAGLPTRQPQAGEPAVEPGEIDAHFWLDPVLVMHYVENIRDGLSLVDPGGKEIYTLNAETYINQLKELDAWIRGQVDQVPAERRLLVTNHESLGYFADRYGLRIVGSVIPSVSSGASPSAKELADLVERVRQAGAKAIFLETGANPALAEQLAGETGIQVVTGLNTHSVDPEGSEAKTYIEMMKSMVETIVKSLKANG